MEKLPKDILIEICKYLNIKDILSIIILNKNYYRILQDNKLWIEIGKRDDPFLDIKNKEDYKIKKPMYVSDEELENYINSNIWAKSWMNKRCKNDNGVFDHRYESYVKSICSDMIRVYKYYDLRTKVNGSIDWKISIGVIVEELLTRSEEDKKYMESISV